jgi:hypothetical protein
MYKGVTYCLELKTEVGYQSKKQLAWQSIVQKQGFQYFVLRDLEEFKQIINNIINK